MAAKGIPLHKVPHFATALLSAAHEWLLIFLLFIHAIFSYSITKFARYCKLQVPCLLCSRLDHILGTEKLGFHWDLICRHHKLEISSLVVCHVHDRLVNVHSMCENCLFSFATINKSNAEKYRLLVGKLGEDPPALDEDMFEDQTHGDSSKRMCSCCSEPYILRNHVQNLLQGHLDFDDLHNRTEAIQELKGYDPLPHVEYSKVKNFSDTESEVPFSDDDDGVALLRESAERKKDLLIHSAPMVTPIASAPSDFISEKLIHTDLMPELSLLDSQGQIWNTDHEGGKHVSSTISIGHGLEEISWLHVKPEFEVSHATTNSEFVKVPQACDAIGTKIEERKVCADGTETVKLEQKCGKEVAYEEVKPVVECEKSAEVSYVENDKVTIPAQLERGLIHEVTFETKSVTVCEASPEIQSVVIDKVTETDKVEQMNIEKVVCEENKPVVEREAGPQMPSVVNDKITETCEQDQTTSEEVTHEEMKPVTELEASLDIPPVQNNKVMETVELKQTRMEKVSPEVKPVTELEASLDAPPVQNNKVMETVDLKQTRIEKVSAVEVKPVAEGKPCLEIPSSVNDKSTQTDELEQSTNEKASHEETKPVIECEASVEIQSVVSDKVTESVKSEQLIIEKVTRDEKKADLQRGPTSEIPSVVNDSATQLELSEAYKLAVGSNRRQLSGKLLEQMSFKESGRMSEDLKLLLSQISAARGIDLPFNEISPRLSGNAEEMKTDSSSVIGMSILQQRITLERNESGLSLDGSVIGEIEGESEVDRLKRQVEHDKKLLVALYKELEEERNASTVAANQAMAMITRLQEEKASLQMEALQCVRMMEEQAEYDVEALQKANDLLAEKEKEIQDLEADLEYLRKDLEDASVLEREIKSSCGLELRNLAAEQSDSNHFKNSENAGSNSTVDKPHSSGKDDLTYNSRSEFEDERLFLLESLRKLEKKLHLFSCDTENSQKNEAGNLKDPTSKDGTQEISSKAKDNDCGGQCYSQVSKMPDAVAIGDAVSNLIRRLEALEANHKGIDKSLKPLKKSDREINQNSGDSLPLQGSAKE